MPWQETSVMEQRLLFVQAVLEGQESRSALCRRYGITRRSGRKWEQRYRSEGLLGLLDRSRAPRRHPNAMAAELAAMILSVRREHPTWGPRKIRAWVSERYGGCPWPAASTIGDLLTRHGLTVPRRRRRRTPPATQPFGACRGANDVWCMDFKGWFRTGDGRTCHPLTLSDAWSRYLLRCQGMERIRQDAVRGVLASAFREYGLPGAIRTDNGSPFAGRGLGGLSRLSVWWLKLGVSAERIDPGQPQQNGRLERLHRTLKAETARPPRATLGSQQRAFNRFRESYNSERPHEALRQRPPATAYGRSERVYPRRPPVVEYDEGLTVRRVRSDGTIKWRGELVFVSETLKAEPVGLDPVSDGRWVVYFCDLPLAVIDDRRGRLWPLHQALRRHLVAAASLRCSVRYAPGASQTVPKVDTMSPV